MLSTAITTGPTNVFDPLGPYANEGSQRQEHDLFRGRAERACCLLYLKLKSTLTRLFSAALNRSLLKTEKEETVPLTM